MPMGAFIKVPGVDEFAFDAYLAEPEGTPRGGVVVLHEIFGVNAYIRDKCDAFARAGYRALAPCLFDRIERGVELDYTREHATHARQTYSRVIDRDLAVLDLGAIAGSLRGDGRVGLVGFSWGATTSWMASGRVDVDAVVGYYASAWLYSDVVPRCPVLLHLGEEDHRIPPEDVAWLRDTHPDVRVHVYPANHGFDCPVPHRGVFRATCAEEAGERTLLFLREHVG